jgi:hypothetical protein
MLPGTKYGGELIYVKVVGTSSEYIYTGHVPAISGYAVCPIVETFCANDLVLEKKEIRKRLLIGETGRLGAQLEVV